MSESELRERIAHTITEAWWGKGAAIPGALRAADAVIAAGLTTPAGMTAEKLNEIGEMLRAYAARCVASTSSPPRPLVMAEEIKAWADRLIGDAARVLDDPEGPRVADPPPEDDDFDWWQQLRELAAAMTDDGDCYVENYGAKLHDLLRLRGEEARVADPNPQHETP